MTDGIFSVLSVLALLFSVVALAAGYGALVVQALLVGVCGYGAVRIAFDIKHEANWWREQRSAIRRTRSVWRP